LYTSVTFAQTTAPIALCTEFRQTAFTNFTVQNSQATRSIEAEGSGQKVLTEWSAYAKLLPSRLNASTIPTMVDLVRLPPTVQLDLLEQGFSAAGASVSQPGLSHRQHTIVLNTIARNPLLRNPRFNDGSTFNTWLEIHAGKPVILAARPSVLHVGGGQDTGGPVPGAAPDRPYKLVSQDGRQCAQPYQPQTLADDASKPANAATPNPLLVNYADYRELVLITRNGSPYCSGVIIGQQDDKTYVLTAGHCVLSSERTRGESAKLEPNLKQEYRVMSTASPSSTAFARSCIGLQPNDCRFSPGVIQSAALYSGDRGPQPLLVPVPGSQSMLYTASPDAALLTVRFDAGLQVRRAEVVVFPPNTYTGVTGAVALDDPTYLTQAGFGFSDDENGQGTLSIGLMSLSQPMETVSPFVKFDYGKSNSRWTKSCQGDSGGPMFWGGPTVQATSAPRKLVALVSAVANAGGTNACRDNQNSFELLQPITTDIRAWLCRTSLKILGCSPKKLPVP
jgi:hypothetical protein